MSVCSRNLMDLSSSGYSPSSGYESIILMDIAVILGLVLALTSSR